MELKELQIELKKAQEELDTYETASLKRKQEMIGVITTIKNNIRDFYPVNVIIRIHNIIPVITSEIVRRFEGQRDAIEFIEQIVEDQGIYHESCDMETIFIPIGSIIYIKIRRLVKQD